MPLDQKYSMGNILSHTCCFLFRHASHQSSHDSGWFMALILGAKRSYKMGINNCSSVEVPRLVVRHRSPVTLCLWLAVIRKIVITHQTPQQPRFLSTSGHQLSPSFSSMVYHIYNRHLPPTLCQRSSHHGIVSDILSIHHHGWQDRRIRRLRYGLFSLPSFPHSSGNPPHKMEAHAGSSGTFIR